MRSRREIGQTIAGLRKAIGMSQHELAPRASISRSTLANIEAGRQGTPLVTLAPIAEALGTTVAAILGEPTQDAVPPDLIAQVVAHQQRITRVMGELAGTMAFLEEESRRLGQLLADHIAARPACSCCGRQVAPLDADGRCGHCGANRAAGTHAGDAPCRPGDQS